MSVARKRLPASLVDCKWWMNGFCRRGTKCLFRHDESKAGIHNSDKADSQDLDINSSGPGLKLVVTDDELAASPASRTINDAESCAICMEIPCIYALLLKCDHCFCLECIRTWRSSNSDVNQARKKCPICRAHSDFVIPSSCFPTADKTAEFPMNTRKQEIVIGYLAKLKTVKCMYFEDSIKKSAPRFKPECKFGNACHYSHQHPDTKEPYVFTKEQLSGYHKKARTRFRPRIPPAGQGVYADQIRRFEDSLEESNIAPDAIHLDDGFDGRLLPQMDRL
ncbi:hypothetical protein BGZ60DRAFT_515670 [Tricladium varicosporioides]|nr:hypothetical protein BGZ60DRAFT_515670 [Hymenoscyphus varicosporioides]